MDSLKQVAEKKEQYILLNYISKMTKLKDAIPGFIVVITLW